MKIYYKNIWNKLINKGCAFMCFFLAMRLRQNWQHLWRQNLVSEDIDFLDMDTAGPSWCAPDLLTDGKYYEHILH